jgi:DNA-directed RNA polymerase specialized sigma24 family protein
VEAGARPGHRARTGRAAGDASRVATRDALQSLPAAQRQALVLRFYADLAVRDVAALMRCPENTVKTHTRRALERLRASGLLDDDVDLVDITEDVG